MKKKLTAVALIVCMLAIMLVGASLAYFTDTTEAKENTFTMGSVEIELTETKWDALEKNADGELKVHGVQPKKSAQGPHEDGSLLQ